MSDKYNDVAEWYARKMWDIKRVKNAVKKGWITPDEYQQITGEKYAE